MSQAILDPHFSAEHANSVGFQPVFTSSFAPAPFQSNPVAPHLSSMGASAPMLVQPGMYAAQDLNTFWKPSPSGHMVKMEPGADMFAPHVPSDFSAYPGSQPMVSSMSLPTYTTHAPERRFTFSDAESLCSVASPSSTSEASTRPSSAKRGAKRKTLADASIDSPAALALSDASPDAAKSNKKTSKQAGQRRPPPSASHITESGKPFPVIDTSAKHSSLFVPPDTSGLTKREARLVKNRAAAFLSRQRKREQFEEMEIKCKGISMLVWRMWEAIAGSEAGAELIDSTPLASVLANEDPAARLCLEEVISKKGGSIAPTADEAEGTPAPEAAVSAQRPMAASASAAKNTTEINSAELERVRSDLAASQARERELAAQLDALRSSMSANVVPVAGFPDAHDWSNSVADVNATQVNLASSMGVGSMPFKAVQGAELPLFVPESPLSKFGMGDATNSTMMLDASHAGFDLSKTPTLAMFSENALRSRSAQQFGNVKDAGMPMGLGLDYRFACASAPSSPSTASSSSMESSQSRFHSLTSNPTSGKAPSTLATVLLLAGMSLMGVGPTANELAATEVPCATPARKNVRAGRKSSAKAKTLARAASELPRANAGQPSSHLSDDDLLMEMGLDSASLSEADDEDVKLPSASSLQPASGSTVTCA